MTSPSARRLDRDVPVVRARHPGALVAASQLPEIRCRRLAAHAPALRVPRGRQGATASPSWRRRSRQRRLVRRVGMYMCVLGELMLPGRRLGPARRRRPPMPMPVLVHSPAAVAVRM